MAAVAKGHIERLPSGSFRVHVYAGTDPVTGKERRLKLTVATEERAAGELARLLRAAEEAGHALEDSATLLRARPRSAWYSTGTSRSRILGVSTRLTHESYIRRIIRPVLGDVRLRNLGPDSLDALYAHLKRCSRLCAGCRRLSITPLAGTSATNAAARCAIIAPAARMSAMSGAGRIGAYRWHRGRS